MFSEKPYYTSSEAMSMVLKPSAAPKVLRPSPSFNITTGTFGTPVYQPLLKPSFVRSVSANNFSSPQFAAGSAFQYAKRQKLTANTRVVSPNPPNKTVLKPKEHHRHQSPLLNTAPFAARQSAVPLKFEYDTTVIPRYSTFDDPHLREYYSKKFGSQNGSMRKTGPAGDEVGYKVKVITGDAPNAGTTARVFLRMIGKNVKVPKCRLAKKDGLVQTPHGKRFRFEPESEITFKIFARSITTMKHIIIEHDGLTKKDSWFLEQIEITNMKNGKTWYFPCHQWLSLYEDDCQISRELQAEELGEKSAITEYEILTKTGNKMGAGTDANVFITITGMNGASPRLHLYSSDRKSPFEKGREDKFLLRTKDVGDLVKIRIEHDNTGMAPGWLLEHVTVQNLQSNDLWHFPCNRWLAKDKDDGRICRDLVPTDSKAPGSGMCTYKITVHTGDKRGAGTDANVFVTLFSAKEDSGEVELDKKFKNDFERGNADEFDVELPHLGKLTMLRVRHDNTGTAPGWFLDKIVVTDPTDNKHYEFPCNRWLAKDEDDKKICRDLMCANSSGKAGDLVAYEIEVITADKRGAGTNANVFIELHTEKSKKHPQKSSGRVPLEDGKFERGDKDKFKIELHKDFSPCSYITMGHDDTGMAPGWFLEKVIVYCPTSGIEQHFPCGRWLATDEDDHLIERDLKEDKKLRKTREKKAGWDVIVHTSDIKGAGTDADVFMVIYGDKGKSDEIPLESESNKFERGQTDQITIDTVNFGRPYKIRIWHNDAKLGSGWHLDSVELVNRALNKKYEFPCKRWLATDEDDGEIVRELPAHGTDIKKPLPVVKYLVQVFTGKKRGGGTDADVFCCIHGELGDTGDRMLKKSSTNKNKFESGNVDEFVIEAVDLKKLDKMRIGHDNSGTGPGWFLDKVVVKKLDSNKKDDEIEFPCGRWLAEDEDDGKIVRELFTKGAAAGKLLNTLSYHLSVKTGDVRNAGTDANVYCILYGDKGDTGKINLKQPENAKDPFERAKTDFFIVESEDIGKLKGLKIGHDGSSPGAGWFLDSVEVKVPSTGHVYLFRADRWLATDEDDGEIEIDIDVSQTHKEDKKIPYEIEIVTGEERSAGTDANVFIQIYGFDGKTDQYNLRNKTDNFEKGATDTFKVESVDVGKVTKIRIGHDGKGRASGWFLDTVKLVKPASKKSKLNTRSKSGRRDSKKNHEKSGRHTEGHDKKLHGKKQHHSKNGHDTETEDDSDEVAGSKRTYRVDKKKKSRRHSLDISDSATVDENDDSSSEHKKSPKIKRSNSLKSAKKSVKSKHSFGGSSDDDDNSLLSEKEKKKLRRHSSTASISTGRGKSARDRRRSYSHTSGNKISEDDSDDDSASEDSKKGKNNKKNAKGKFETYYFVCKRWFAKGEDDGQIIRELVPTDEHGRPLKDNNLQESEYSVHVFTGDVSGAGTDSNVWINVSGEHGDTGDRQLKKSQNTNKFERNQEDIFQINSVDLGELKKLKIWHDNSGLGSDWYLNRVEVRGPGKNDIFIFPCERWLSKDNDDGQLCRELVPLTAAQMKRLKRNKSTSSLKDEMGLELKSQLNTYIISVVTGKKRGAGTDANVYLNLVGEDDSTGNIQLKTSKTNKNKFENGQTDVFEIEAVKLGELKKIVIGHDNAGGFADWHLDYVDIDCPSLGKKWHFPCDQWLSSSKDDRQLERELYPSDMATQDYESCIPYEFTVYTSDVRGASTDADVYVSLHSKDGRSTRRVSLCPNKSDRKKCFERKSVDKFIVELENIGDKLSYLRIGHDGSGIGAGWHLDKVELKKLDKKGKGYVIYEFPCGRWLAADEADGAIELDLPVANKIKESEGESPKSARSMKSRKESLSNNSGKMKTYQVKVITGDVAKAGTDSNVYIRLYGDKGDSGQKQLKKSETHFNKFERGQTDIFKIDAVDLGTLFRLDIGHDDSGISSDWFLDSVEVSDVDKQRSFTFPCNLWISKSKDGQLERVLYIKGYEDSHSSHRKSISGRHGRSMSSSSTDRSIATHASMSIGSARRIDRKMDPDVPLIPYTIKVTTGEQKDAGTDAPCWIAIHGFKKQSTGRLLLEILSRNPPSFLAGKTEVFSVDAAYVGKLSHVELGIDAEDKSETWFVQELEIHMPTKGQSYVIPVNQWFGKEKDDGATKRKFTIDDASVAKIVTKPRIPHELTVHTGDINDAGTSSNVFLKLFGSNGFTEEVSIEKFGERFERGRVDVIKLELEDVGEPKKLRIGIDCHGKRPEWFLEKIQLQNLTNDKIVHFACSKWFSKSQSDGLTVRDLPAISDHGKVMVKTTSYVVTVKTSDIRGAGTDANVFITLFGEFGDSDELPLKTSTTHRNKFERNSSDVFIFQDILSVGHLSKIRIWHDNSGVGAAWHLDNVTVHDERQDFTYIFPCNQWLSDSDDDKQLCRELLCATNNNSRPSTSKSGRKNSHRASSTDYEVTIVTGDKKDAGTLHHVWIALKGQKGDSQQHWFENGVKKKIFRRGQADVLPIQCPHLGELDTVLIGHFPREDVPISRDAQSERENQWYCQEVVIVDEDDGTKYVFPCKLWLPLSTKPKDAAELFCKKRDAVNGSEKQLPVVQYELSVVTGDERGAGTDANVYCTIFGEFGDTGKRHLTQKYRNLFERGKTDLFIVENQYLGKLNKLRIEHDNSGLGAGWHLDRVEVRMLNSSELVVFPCQKWLDDSTGDGLICRDLLPRNS